MDFGEKSREKSGKKWSFLTPVFWPFHRCETGKRGYGVKFQVSQIKNGWPFLIESIKNRNGYMWRDREGNLVVVGIMVKNVYDESCIRKTVESGQNRRTEKREIIMLEEFTAVQEIVMK